MSVQTLIQKYEAELRILVVDQRTDDAMSPDAYSARHDLLERIIADLKAITL